MPVEPTPQPTVEMTRENLDTLGALETLATIAAASLKQYGQATFVMRPDGGVAFANPLHVHIHPQAVEDLGDKPYHFVRPILGDGRPNYVAWKNGILWEVDFDDGQLQGQSEADSGR
jgi:tRNA1(Val) A37 N6-methylase TrmN6